LLVIFTSEREAAAEEGEEEDTRSVNISVRATKLNFANYLWSHVGRSSAE